MTQLPFEPYAQPRAPIAFSRIRGVGVVLEHGRRDVAVLNADVASELDTGDPTALRAATDAAPDHGRQADERRRSSRGSRR
jgi:hypothetical protein